jgi:hypothetical protein
MPLFLRQGDELGKQHEPVGETPGPEADDEQFPILEKRLSRFGGEMIWPLGHRAEQ